MLKINSFVFFFVLFSPILLSAQKWSVGVSSGIAVYQGDVTERYYLHQRDYKPTVGGFIKYQLSNRFSLRASYLKGEIAGSDANYTSVEWRMKRAFSFKSPITEYATMVEWDVIKKRFQKRHASNKQSISVYLMGGVGYVKTNPQADFNETNPLFDDVNPDKLAQYNRNHLVIPMGVGVKWHITPHKTLSVESGSRTTFTDYLDGISKTAQPKYGDWYLIGAISFSQQLSFGGKNNKSYGRMSNARVSCPRFK